LTLFPAFIQATGAIIAAAVAVSLWWLKTKAERLDEDRRRYRKAEDVVRAVRADIMVELDTLRSQFEEPNATVYRKKLLSQLADKPVDKSRGSQPPANMTKKDMPQGKAAPQSFVFDIIKSDLTILPTELVELVVAYYRHDQRLGALIDAFSGGVYADIDDARQTEAVEGYFRLGQRVLDTALKAKSGCDAFLRTTPAIKPAE
jgi:hypothetical protein